MQRQFTSLSSSSWQVLSSNDLKPVLHRGLMAGLSTMHNCDDRRAKSRISIIRGVTSGKRQDETGARRVTLRRCHAGSRSWAQKERPSLNTTFEVPPCTVVRLHLAVRGIVHQ